MTMMISKFHRLIQSRLLWGAFLIIIVFSFVVWGMVWPSQINKQNQANAAGTLAGETITPGEYRSAYLSTYMGRRLAMGREAPWCSPRGRRGTEARRPNSRTRRVRR